MPEVTRTADGGYHLEVRPARAWERALYAVIRAILFVFSKVYFRLRIEGTEHVPTSVPFVLAPVHRSNIDFFLVSAVTRRRMRYMGKDSIWKWDLGGRFVSALGAFPVRRGTADREALRACQQIVEAGEPLVMFPEGTRQSGPIVQPLFDGPAYVAARAGIPIVPVGIGGSERAMPKGSKMIRPVKLAMVIGPPIYPPRPDAEGARVPRRVVRELTDELYGEVQRLFDAAQSRV
jgi:1-acyl-sn-glycerol-3-phosphate acyltransferase